MSNLKRSKEWRDVLDGLMDKTGISLEEISRYIGSPYNGKETGFYAKLPQKRRKFIGIGMALGQPLEVINDWILTYSGKRRLYAKDVSEDLVWIYLIGLNYNARAHGENIISGTNYFSLYEQCQNVAYATYCELWYEAAPYSMETSDLDIRLESVAFDDEFEGLRNFIIDNMDSFKTAYTKPRKMLEDYVDGILIGMASNDSSNDNSSRSHAEAEDQTEKTDTVGARLKLNSLRGYLDDSMINYLSGDSSTIHVIDRRQGIRTISTKHIPTNRKTHISICLALGMMTDEINRYLEMMGFAPLGENSNDEKNLIEALKTWDEAHTLQREFKSQFIIEDRKKTLSQEEMRRAVESILLLRQDLKLEFSKRDLEFPYYKKEQI